MPNALNLAIMCVDAGLGFTPFDWMGLPKAPAEFEDLLIYFNSVVINDSIHLHVTEFYDVYNAGAFVTTGWSTNVFMNGHVDVQLWNGFHPIHNRLTGPAPFNPAVFNPGEQGAPSFGIGSTSINKVDINFTLIHKDEIPEKPAEENQATVELIARDAIQWNMWRSSPVVIDKDDFYDITLNITGGVDRLVGLALVSAGGTFDETTGFIGKARPADRDWLNRVFLDFETIEINGVAVSNTWGDYLISRGHPPTDGYIDAQLWNGFYPLGCRLQGLQTLPTSSDEPAPSFLAPGATTGGTPITTIRIRFEVWGITSDPATRNCGGRVCGHILPPDRPCRCGLREPNLPKGCAGEINVQLMAREAEDWFTKDGNHWRSETHTIRAGQETQTFTLRVDTPRPSPEHPGYFSLCGLSLMTAGGTFEHPFGFIDATTVPSDWWRAMVAVSDVKINGLSINNTWANVEGEGQLVSRGDASTEGFINVELWNSWWADNRQLTGPNIREVITDGVPSVGLANGAVIENIEVTFTVTLLPNCGTVPCSCDLVTCLRCDQDEYPDNPCTCEAPVDSTCVRCGQSPCSRTGACAPVVPPVPCAHCGLTTCTGTCQGDARIRGDINNDGVIDIMDALDILKHLAGIEFLTGENLQAALLMGEPEISINDALEILKHLAGITPNKVDNP
jgi:hypothetical protein